MVESPTYVTWLHHTASITGMVLFAGTPWASDADLLLFRLTAFVGWSFMTLNWVIYSSLAFYHLALDVRRTLPVLRLMRVWVPVTTIPQHAMIYT